MYVKAKRQRPSFTSILRPIRNQRRSIYKRQLVKNGLERELNPGHLNRRQMPYPLHHASSVVVNKRCQSCTQFVYKKFKILDSHTADVRWQD